MTDIDMQWSKVHYIMNSKNYMKFLKASLNRYVLSKDFLWHNKLPQQQYELLNAPLMTALEA